jgi:oligoribonuclease NrnB/cAMP/cGMP phosphodiesterase (DHH superfamily)
MICFYHSVDFDGICSAALVKLKYPDCVLYPFNYYDEFPWEMAIEHKNVWMVDISLEPADDMKKLNGLCNVTWIDHHAKVIEKLVDYPIKGLQSTEKAACELVWNYTNESQVPLAVHWLSLYDTWKHEFDEEILNFQAGINALPTKDTDPNNTSFWSKLILLYDNEIIPQILALGKIISEFMAKQNLKNSLNAYEIKFEGYRALVLNSLSHSSFVFADKFNKDKHDLMLVYSNVQGKYWRISLYTNGKTDVGAIAVKFGGGGHVGAAGFKCITLPSDPITS